MGHLMVKDSDELLNKRIIQNIYLHFRTSIFTMLPTVIELMINVFTWPSRLGLQNTPTTSLQNVRPHPATIVQDI